MKRSEFKFFGCVTVILLLLIACEKTPAIEAEPLWSKQDVLNTGALVKSTGGLLIQREVTLYLKPPFYSGQMPLQYKTISKETGGGMMGSMAIPLSFDFGSWRVLFIYTDTLSLLTQMPAGAVAVNNENNTLVAECKIMKMLDTDQQLTGFEIEEIHYDKEGKHPIFTSTFLVNYDDGFKTNEKNVKGRKEKDYFFIWPTGLNGHF